MKYFLLALALLLTACTADPATPGQAPQAVLASPPATMPQEATQQAQATPEVVEATQTPDYSPTPDLLGTEVAAQAAHDAAQVQIAQARAAEAQADAQGADAAKTVVSMQITAAAVSDATDTALQVMHATGTKDSQVFAERVPTIIVAGTQAVNTQGNIVSRWVFEVGTGISLALIGACLLIAILRLIPDRERQEQGDDEIDQNVFEDEQQKYHRSPPLPAYTSLHIRVIPAGVTEVTLLHFARNVRTSTNKSGIPFSRSWWVNKGLMKRAEWDALITFLEDPKYNYAMPVNPDAENSAMSFTPEGEQYLNRFVHEPAPSSATTLNPI